MTIHGGPRLMQASERSAVPAFEVMRITDQIATRRAAGHDVVSLCAGEPSARPTPGTLKPAGYTGPLGTMPLRSDKRGEGERDTPVRFAGATFRCRFSGSRYCASPTSIDWAVGRNTWPGTSGHVALHPATFASSNTALVHIAIVDRLVEPFDSACIGLTRLDPSLLCRIFFAFSPLFSRSTSGPFHNLLKNPIIDSS